MSEQDFSDEDLVKAQFSSDVDKALLARRFMSFTPKRGVGCWLWAGHKRASGYGGFRMGSVANVQAHRAALLLVGVSLADKREVHHRCFNTGCVRPSHLEVLTREEHYAKAKLAKLGASTVSS